MSEVPSGMMYIPGVGFVWPGGAPVNAQSTVPSYTGPAPAAPPPTPAAPPPNPSAPPGSLPTPQIPDLSWLSQGGGGGMGDGGQNLGGMLNAGLLASSNALPGLLNMPSQTMASGGQFFGSIPWGLAPQDARQLMLSQAQRAFAQPPSKPT